MKKILIISMMLFLASCNSTVSILLIKHSIKTCQVNKGLKYIERQDSDITIECMNGSSFQVYYNNKDKVYANHNVLILK